MRVLRLARRLVLGLLVLVGVAVGASFLVPRLLGDDTYVITTGSMRGTVDPGTLVISERVPVSQLHVGDVITYAPPAATGVHHLVTHRIVRIGKDRLGTTVYRTKGDANSAPDPWTFSLQSAVQARMVGSVPYVGRPALWLADPSVRRAAIGVPAVALAVMALVDVVRVLRRRTDDAGTPGVVIDLTDTPSDTSDDTVLDLPVPATA